MKFADMGPGDVVTFKRTFRVTQVTPECVNGVDTKSGTKVVFFGPNVNTNYGNCRFELVAKAPKPKPKAGTVLSGAEMSDIWWKRGTIIRCVESGGGTTVPEGTLSGLVLAADGQWVPLDNPDERVEFMGLVPTAKFRLEYVPE